MDKIYLNETGGFWAFKCKSINATVNFQCVKNHWWIFLYSIQKLNILFVDIKLQWYNHKFILKFHLLIFTIQKKNSFIDCVALIYDTIPLVIIFRLVPSTYNGFTVTFVTLKIWINEWRKSMFWWLEMRKLKIVQHR